MPEQISQSALVPTHSSGQRLDQVATQLFNDYSRAQLQQWIRDGKLSVNGQAVVKPKHRLSGSEQLNLCVELSAHSDDLPEDIPLSVLYKDEHLLVVNKPAGMVVHPGAGNPNGTLVNALLHYDENLALQPRAGIVHRLDKDTSGALLVARDDVTRQLLSAMLKARDIHRYYSALVWGECEAEGTIDLPLGRHPVDRVRMAVRPASDHNARPAVTHYRLQQAFPGMSLLQVKLETGRTHQIRVHLTHQGFPLVGDQTYRNKGSINRLPVDASLQQNLENFPRQCLHAAKLEWQHPISKDMLKVQAPMPEDFADLLEHLNHAID